MTTEYKKKNGKIVKIETIETEIDRGDLRIELRGIEEQLSKVVSDKDLLEWARANYPYPIVDVEKLTLRAEEIRVLLEIK